MKKALNWAFFIIYVTNFSLTWHSFHFLCHPTTPSDVDVTRSQGVGLNEIPTRFHQLSHQRCEYLVSTNRIFDLHPEQATNLRIHCRFPELFRVHFAQAFIALLADTAFDFVE